MELKFRYVYRHISTGEIIFKFYMLEDVEHFTHTQLQYTQPYYAKIGRDLFTGFNDKNGVEIYENDMVEGKNVDYFCKDVTTATVVFENGGFFPFADNEDHQPYPRPEECVIVGNLYERVAP